MTNRKVPNVSGEGLGLKSKKIIEEFNKYKHSGASVHPSIVWKRASGAVVEDIDGNTYIDFTAGIAVANAGHCPPLVVKAVKEQVEKLINCYDHPTIVRTRLQKKLAELCTTDLRGDKNNKVLLVTGGTEGVDSAVKLSKRYTGKYEVITTQGGFHGRSSFLGMSLTDHIRIRKGYGPMVPGILHVPYAYCYRCFFEKTYPDCDLLCTKYFERVVEYESTDNIAAFIVEPIQAAVGYVVPPDEYLVRVKEFCERHNVLLIADEIQTGFGRSGKFLAMEYPGVKPDIILLGKGIGSGIPLTAIVAREGIFNSLKPGDHSSTYGGNPISCAASLATIAQIRKDNLIDNGLQMGKYIIERLFKIKEKHKLIGDVRGRGLLIGIEFVIDQKKKTPATKEVQVIREKVYKKGLLVLSGGLWGSVLRVVPPLCIDKKLVDIGLEILDEAIEEAEKGI